MKLTIPWMATASLLLLHAATVRAWISSTTSTKCPTRTTPSAPRGLPPLTGTTLFVFPFQQGQNNNKKPVLKSLQIRAVDPSAVPAVGTNVVAMSDLTELGLWEFQSYAIQAITDYPATSDSNNDAPWTNHDQGTGIAVERLDDFQTEGCTRYVTLSGRSVGSVTMRLAGIYNHGLSSLWILETFI